MSVFVDTSALLPLLDRSDDNHRAVTAAVRELAQKDEVLVTTSYTLVEAGALVKRRLGKQAFEKLGETATQAFEIVWIDEDLHARAWALATKQARDGPSLVDCAAFLVMREEKVPVALAIDRHFRDEGFEVIPG